MHTIRKATLVLGMVVASSAMAASVAIDESPLEGGISSTVRSNIMFVLDDSGSMESAYVPDGVNTSETRYANRSSQCNGMAYNPGVTYDPPMRSDGTSLPNARFASAWEDGFAAENLTTTNSTSSRTVGTGSLTFNISSSSGFSTTVGQLVQITRKTDRNIWMVGTITAWASPNLTVNVTSINGSGTYNAWNITDLRNLGVSSGSYNNRYFTYSGAQPTLGYAYDGAGNLINNTFRNECNSNIGGAPGNAVFTQVNITSVSTDAQNYANWYSYYRFRRNTMKTAMTLAFGKMANPERFRVGLSTINYTGTSNADARYLDIDDYCDADTNCTHRQNFVGKLLGIPGTNSATPLRGALSKAGRIYGGLLVTGTRDPVQHSCQKNFAILSTDGYWNEGSPAGRSVTGVLNLGDQDSAARTDYKAYNVPYAPTAMESPMADRSNVGAGTPDVLGDVAMYYYKTVIRSTAFGNCTSGSTGENLCPDPGNVPVSVRGGVADKERWDCNRFQHMNTYTIGLGVKGTLNADNYLTGGSVAYEGLKAGTTQWPAISNNNATGVDDLWHAAVNGRGEYYSASDPAEIVSSLNKALAAIGASVGTGSAAGSSSQQLRTGDNAYLSRYATEDWSGDIQALRLDPATGALLSTPSTPQAACDASATTVSDPVWSAQEELDDKLVASPDSSSRRIYVASGGSLVNFTAANVSNTDFDPTTLSQYAALSAAEKLQATKASLVAYLRGVSKVAVSGSPAGDCCEDQAGNVYRLYRDRSHVLGDIVNSTPYFSGKSPFSYGDAGYVSYRDSTTASRRRVLFAGANDGMLHAFDAGVPPDTDGSGEELWAFIPSGVLPRLSKLADFGYNANHRFFVNGDMNTGDVSDGAGNWKTILVGGLGAGGRDYYALDVTNPNSPVLLWEFRARNPGHADNMGLSYGAPQITKRKSDGKWVVLVSSGYNNTSPGDGKARLYVIDALSGLVLQEMQTSGPADPSRSGIGGVSGWVDATMTNNETQYVYAGDLDGKLWRFDIVANSVTQLAEFANGGTVQPITRRPELGEVTMGTVKNRWIFVGTSRTLAETDVDPTLPGSTATEMQSFYAVRDDGINTYGGTSFRSVAGVVELDLTGTATTRIMNYVPAGTSAPGWYFDFDVVSGEKVNTDVTLQVGWLTFGTRAPKPTAGVCDRKVDGFQYFISYNPQSSRISETWETTWLGDSGATGVAVIQTSTGETVVTVTDDQGNIKVIENKGDHGLESVRRVSWRELPN